MVMVLTLFVYNYLERELRNRIKQKNETVENLVKKQVTNPTMKMVFVQFRGISTLTLPANGETAEQIEDLDHKQTHILNILGENYLNVYA
jgi:transposase